MRMKTSQEINLAGKRLERATQYVSDLWFPANPQLVAKIRSTLATDSSTLDLDSLLHEVQGDYSLFLFCVRKMLQMLRDEHVSLPKTSNPVEILHQGGIDRLRQIMGSNDELFSRHFFDGMADTQCQRMREAMISASTVQTLARVGKVDPELGYFTALVRQLGHTLIAWNYPGVYQNALTNIQEKKDKSIDVALHELLGFSPAMLAISLAHQWQLPAEVILSLENEISGYDPEAEDIELEVDAIGRSITELCRIGEALARANSPETYPTARTDWDFARKEIVNRLGPQGLDAVKEAIIENCQQYSLIIPNFFRGGAILDAEAFSQKSGEHAASEGNGYIRRCRPHVQEKLLELYKDLQLGHSIQGLLRTIAQKVVPACGFAGAWVYTVDPTATSLTPQLRVGKVRLRQIEPVTCGLETTEDVVGLAFQSPEPICKTGFRSGELEIAVLAAILGHSQRLGVIYVELPQVLFNDSEQVHMTHLRALSIALNDCLNLK